MASVADEPCFDSFSFTKVSLEGPEHFGGYAKIIVAVGY